MVVNPPLVTVVGLAAHRRVRRVDRWGVIGDGRVSRERHAVGGVRRRQGDALGDRIGHGEGSPVHWHWTNRSRDRSPWPRTARGCTTGVRLTALPCDRHRAGAEQRHGHRGDVDAVGDRGPRARRSRSRGSGPAWSRPRARSRHRAGVPLSVLLGATKKGVDHRWGWVKSFWFVPDVEDALGGRGVATGRRRSGPRPVRWSRAGRRPGSPVIGEGPVGGGQDRRCPGWCCRHRPWVASGRRRWVPSTRRG